MTWNRIVGLLHIAGGLLIILIGAPYLHQFQSWGLGANQTQPQPTPPGGTGDLLIAVLAGIAATLVVRGIAIIVARDGVDPSVPLLPTPESAPPRRRRLGPWLTGFPADPGDDDDD